MLINGQEPSSWLCNLLSGYGVTCVCVCVCLFNVRADHVIGSRVLKAPRGVKDAGGGRPPALKLEASVYVFYGSQRGLHVRYGSELDSLGKKSKRLPPRYSIASPTLARNSPVSALTARSLID